MELWLRWSSICLECKRPGFEPSVGKIPWRRKWQSTPGLLPGKSHGQRSLVDYSPWGRKESDTTERLHYFTAVQNPPANVADAGLITGSGRFPGEGNRNPLQYSCLGNPMDRGILVGYSLWGHKESDMTEQLTLYFLLLIQAVPSLDCECNDRDC